MAQHAVHVAIVATSKQYAEVHKGRDKAITKHKEIRQSMKSSKKKKPTRGRARAVAGILT